MWFNTQVSLCPIKLNWFNRERVELDKCASQVSGIKKGRSLANPQKIKHLNRLSFSRDKTYPTQNMIGSLWSYRMVGIQKCTETETIKRPFVQIGLSSLVITLYIWSCFLLRKKQSCNCSRFSSLQRLLRGISLSPLSDHSRQPNVLHQCLWLNDSVLVYEGNKRLWRKQVLDALYSKCRTNILKKNK